MAEPILLVQLVSTLAMVGIIWFVQVVHYPLFELVGNRGFANYEQAHQFRTTLVVAPLMLTEAATAVASLWLRPEGVSPALAVGGVLLLAIIWFTTYACQVPAHTQLAKTFDTATHRWLVASNWIRTAAWTARGVVVGTMCFQALELTQ